VGEPWCSSTVNSAARFLGHERRSWAHPHCQSNWGEGASACEALISSKLPPRRRCCTLKHFWRAKPAAAFGASALIFALIVLALAEVAGWQTLRLYITSIVATLVLLGINLVIAGVLVVFAAWSSPSNTEREALRVRQEALNGARGALAITSAVPLLKLAGSKRRRAFFRFAR
jgi:hypothetical protein